MKIEKLTDISVIIPLITDYKISIGEKQLTENQYKALEAAVNAKEIIFFIAIEQTEAIAMCSISRTFSTFDCCYSGVFEDFYITPEYRKSGLAAKLTAFVFDYCRENKICSLWVGSADCDIEMYNHLGFDIQLGSLLAWNG